MSFSWANDLVKNTLKNAQRQIDSVLDIHDEEEEQEENIHLDETKSGSDDITEHTEEIDDIPKPEEHEAWQWEAPDEVRFHFIYEIIINLHKLVNVFRMENYCWAFLIRLINKFISYMNF